MQEVAQEIQAIRKACEEVIKTQRHDFQMELKRVNGRRNQIEARPTLSVNNVIVPRAQKTVAIQHSTQDRTKTQDASRTPIVPPSTKLTKRLKIVKPIQKSYIQIAASNPAQEITEKT